MVVPASFNGNKIVEVVHSALLARLQVDDTHAYILKDREGG